MILPNRKMRQKAGFFAGICAALMLVPWLPAGITRAARNTENVRVLYEEYNARFDAVEHREDITENGFEIVDIHIFPVQYEIDMQKEMETELVRQMKAQPDADIKDLKMNMEAPMLMIPAYDKMYNRLALFFCGWGRHHPV